MSTHYPDGWRFDTKACTVTEPTGRVFHVALRGLELVALDVATRPVVHDDAAVPV